jgi:DNA-binding Lrp family transcriptional regulator
MGSEKRYLNIPYEILYNNQLDSDNKLILAEIHSLSKLRNGCTASDNHFAKMISKKRSAVNGRMKKLEKLGFISIEVVQGKGKKTRLTQSFWDLELEPATETEVGCHNLEQLPASQAGTGCHNHGTIITTNTDELLQKVLQYTGAKTFEEASVYEKSKIIIEKISQLVEINPETIENTFLSQLNNCCIILNYEFGPSIFEKLLRNYSIKELQQYYCGERLYLNREEIQEFKNLNEKFWLMICNNN